MTYAATVLAHSIARNVELISLEVCFPRFILAEFNTHRVLSRNSVSSRAIPVEKRLKQVLENPFVPEAFTVNKRGMQADQTLDDRDGSRARDAWLAARDAAVEQAEKLVDLGVHKQHANRLLEPYAWHTVVVSATKWENFFNLRTDAAAQPEMQITARLMLEAVRASQPERRFSGEWHLPYVSREERDTLPVSDTLALSTARCAAVSFERQHADRPIEATRERVDQMAQLGHWSPFEHQAVVVVGAADWPSNFCAPWKQQRKFFDGEAVWSPR